MLFRIHRSSVAVLAMLSLPLAALSHGEGHGAHKPRPTAAAPAAETAFGREGDPKKATRTVTIAMTDDMRFTPAVVQARQGETLRLKVVNQGKMLHELVLGTQEELRAHAEAMKKHPGMEHDAPYMVHVEPGREGEVVWQFTRKGEFPFACLLPGHFEAGMVGKVVVQ